MWPRVAVEMIDEAKTAANHLRIALLGNRYCEEVTTTLDVAVRKNLERGAAKALEAWCMQVRCTGVEAHQP